LALNSHQTADQTTDDEAAKMFLWRKSITSRLGDQRPSFSVFSSFFDEADFFLLWKNCSSGRANISVFNSPFHSFF